LDRRTNRPEGSGRASTTVVTSRADDEDLAIDESIEDAVPDEAIDAAADTTLVDAVPALPADNLGRPRATRPNGQDSPPRSPAAPAAGREPAAAGKAAAEPRLDDASPAPPPAGSAASQAPAAEPSADTPTPTVPSGTMPSGTEPSGTPSSDGSDSKGKPADTESPESTAPATTTVSPAAFAWEMPDPPPESRSSPARAFLRSDTNTKAKRDPAPAAAAAKPGKTATAGPASKARSVPQQTVPTAPKRSARQAHLTVARVEPWSVMKFSFVVSLVAFVILFVAVSLLYGVLSGLGVFDSLQRVVNSVTSSQTSTGVNAKAWFSASRVLGYTALLGSLNIVLITAMSTIGSVVYNLTSRLVGGVEVTLRETE
jgi:hypothetical protein